MEKVGTVDIVSRDNARVKEVHRLLAEPRYRRQTGLFVTEGVRLCEDAVRSGLIPKSVLLTRQVQQKYAAALAPVTETADSVCFISEELAAFVGNTASPQGVFAVYERLAALSSSLSEKCFPGTRYLALEDVQDPANIGAMVRTAEALGVDGLLLSKGCCDVYSPKVLRASMGGVFRLPVWETEAMPETVRQCQAQAFVCYAAVVDATAPLLTETVFAPKSVCVIGNEGNGLQAETVARCDQCVTIPMTGQAESLNAAMAAGIFLWEMTKPACDVR